MNMNMNIVKNNQMYKVGFKLNYYWSISMIIPNLYSILFSENEF